MATEIKNSAKTKSLEQYPDDAPLGTFEQNLETEERLILIIESEMAAPPVDANKFKIRLRELSAINQEIRSLLNLNPLLVAENPSLVERSQRSVARIENLFALAKSIFTDEANTTDVSQGSNPPPPGPIDNLPGSEDDDQMEARIAKLEVGAEYIQRDIKELKEDLRAVRSDITGIRTTDFRLIFGAIITVALGLAAMMAKGFHWF